ncbi:hypothetical protein [Pacificispira sp.]|uniref:hypothetical protein n=1 Tax=Pacificispira sp. TaxID=2888761 RepID=UPI003BAAF35E
MTFRGTGFGRHHNGPAELDGVRQRAVAHYADTHTWSQRVATLMPAIQKLYWPSAAIAA